MTAPTPVDVVETHCPYCALQCGIVARTSPTLSVVGNRAFPVNAGALCAKGWNAAAVVDHPERLREPLARDRAGRLVPVGWRYALDRIALGIRDTIRTHGADAVGILGSGALTNEKAYLLGKFARVAVGTANIDYNGRYCMSSGAAASNKAFGLDRGLPFPLEDLEGADVDPARRQQPGRDDAAVHALPRDAEGARRRAHRHRSAPVGHRAAGDAAPAADAGHRHGARQRPAPRAAARRPGRPGLHRAAHRGLRQGPRRRRRLLARAASSASPASPRSSSSKRRASSARPRRGFVLTGRGPEQQAQGVANALAYINIALACGFPGTEGSGFGILTGQGNGQGGREHGQKADQLPGYRSISDPAARRAVAGVWRVSPDSLPGPGKSAYELLQSCGTDGGVRALFVMGFNAAGLVAGGARGRSAARVARLPRRLRLLPVRDGADGRRRPARRRSGPRKTAR